METKDYMWLGLVTIIVAVIVVVRQKYLKRVSGEDKQLQIVSNKEIVDEFSKIIKKFGDNFGAIWKVSTGHYSHKEAIFDNIGMIIKYSDIVMIKEWWDTFIVDREGWDDAMYAEKAKVLLTIFEQCGVSHNQSQTHIIDSDTLNYYIIVEEEPLVGERANVLTPFWLYRNEVIEKGILTYK